MAITVTRKPGVMTLQEQFEALAKIKKAYEEFVRQADIAKEKTEEFVKTLQPFSLAYERYYHPDRLMAAVLQITPPEGGREPLTQMIRVDDCVYTFEPRSFLFINPEAEMRGWWPESYRDSMVRFDIYEDMTGVWGRQLVVWLLHTSKKLEIHGD